MAKLESSFKNMVVVLSVIALISSFLLGFVYNFTAEPIEKAKHAKQQKAIKEVLPEFDRYDLPVEVNGLSVYKAYKNNRFVGAAVESFSPHGFSGDIKVMVGFDEEGRIVNYVVLEQKETPGLGTKIIDWFKTDKNNQSIIHKNPDAGSFKLKKDGGEIDAITASTISSRAFIQAVVEAYNAYAENPNAPNALTGASNAVEETTGATELNGVTKATEDSETGVKKEDSLYIRPTPVKSVKETYVAPVKAQENAVQPAGVKPEFDSTSGATKGITDNKDSLKEDIHPEDSDSIVIKEYKTKDEIETERLNNDSSGVTSIEKGMKDSL